MKHIVFGFVVQLALVVGLKNAPINVGFSTPKLSLMGTSNSVVSKLGADLAGLQESIMGLVKESVPMSDMEPMIKAMKELITNEMRPDMLKQRNISQKEMDGLGKQFLQCTPSGNIARDTKAAEHKACRELESSLKTTMDKACLEVPQAASKMKWNCSKFVDINNLDIWPSEAPTICIKSAQKDNILHFTELTEYWEGKLAEYDFAYKWCNHWTQRSIDLNKTCDVKTTEYGEQTRKCQVKQNEMDEKFCQDFKTAGEACNKYTTCWELANQAVIKANRTIETLESELKEQWVTMSRIDCFLDALKSDPAVLEAEIQTCVNKNYNSSAIDIQYKYFTAKEPYLPQPQQCSHPDIFQPGTSRYREAYYDKLPSNAPADDCVTECCTKCKFFTGCGMLHRNETAREEMGYTTSKCCIVAR